MTPEERKTVEAALGDRVICDRCGATLGTYQDKCRADLADKCPGFQAIEAALDPMPALPPEDGTPWITHLEAGVDDDGGWNLETSGMPSEVLFSNALQVWASAQNRPVKVDEAALAFNVAPTLIRQAVEAHYWLYLAGDEIEHEGE
jgi:ribosomal protein L40E